MLRDLSGSLCFHQPDCFACRGVVGVIRGLDFCLKESRAAKARDYMGQVWCRFWGKNEVL